MLSLRSISWSGYAPWLQIGDAHKDPSGLKFLRMTPSHEAWLYQGDDVNLDQDIFRQSGHFDR